MKTKRVQDIVIASLGITLVFLATWLIKIPNGLQGYIHAGDGFLLLFASILHPSLAFLVGGIGSALADIAGGYAIYAIPTLLIKGLEATLVSLLVYKGHPHFRYIAYAFGSLLMLGGYVVADAFINQSWQLALTAMLPNLLQATTGYIIALAAYPLLQKQVHRHSQTQEKPLQ